MNGPVFRAQMARVWVRLDENERDDRLWRKHEARWQRAWTARQFLRCLARAPSARAARRTALRGLRR